MAQTFDSDREQIGTLYARALLAAALAAGKADEIVDELEAFVADVLSKLPKVEAILGSLRLRLPPERRVEMIQEATGGRMSQLLVNTLKVMAKNGRGSCIREMARAARKLLNESKGQVEVTMVTAAPVAASQTEQVTNRLKEMLGKGVVLKTEIRPEMLGGIMVRVGDTLYDGSVANRLEKMRSEALTDTLQVMRSAPQRFET